MHKKDKTKITKRNKKTLIGFLMAIFAILVAVCAYSIIIKYVNNRKEPTRDEEGVNMSDIFKNITLNKSYKKANSNNALYTQRFGADPGVMVYDGKVYVYTTTKKEGLHAKSFFRFGKLIIRKSRTCSCGPCRLPVHRHGPPAAAHR